MPKSRSRINLNILFSQTNQPKLYAKALSWLLSTGKYFVIVVELLVVGGFVYRFSLDAKLQDLQDEINQQVPYIKSLQADEALIRQTQLQLTTIKESRHDDLNLPEVFKKIATLTPQNIKLINVTINKGDISGKTTLSLVGTAINNYEVSYFVKALQKDPLFVDISLTNVSLEKSLINFTINGTVLGDKSRRVN